MVINSIVVIIYYLNETTNLVLLGNGFYEEVCPDVVDIWYQDRRILGFVIRRIDVLL